MSFSVEEMRKRFPDVPMEEIMRRIAEGREKEIASLVDRLNREVEEHTKTRKELERTIRVLESIVAYMPPVHPLGKRRKKYIHEQVKELIEKIGEKVV